MWDRRKSRASFLHFHRGQTIPGSREAATILGEHLPSGSNGNYALLDSLVLSFDSGVAPPGKPVSGLYCGLMPVGSAFAESAIVQRGAWIGIGAQCLQLAIDLSKVALVFP